MHVEIQHWETSPTLDWNIYHGGFCINCHNPKQNKEWPMRYLWEPKDFPFLWQKSILKGCNTVYETQSAYSTISLSLWLLHTSKTTASFGHQSLDHEACKNSYTDKLKKKK